MHRYLITMNSFLNAHSTAATLILATLLILSGFLRFRADRGASIAGVSSWILALVILSLALSGLPASGAIGIIFLIVAVGLGILGIMYMLRRARTGTK